jgi:hypothetical protein
MKTSLLTLRNLLVTMLLLVGALNLRAQGTAFTYQGRLNDGINPANGTYNLRFALFDALTVGNQVGSPLTNSPVNVSNGLFTVTLDFGANFPGADRWLEIGVRTNGIATFTNLVPRQKITPSPYAIYAAGASAAGISGTIPAANLTGTYGNAVTFNNPANSFSGNGTGLSNVNAISLGGFGASSFWNLGGNAGTTPGTQFLGTTDNLPMEFKVNGARALRLEPTANGTPNIIAGSAANSVAAGAFGVTIGGGGNNLADTGTGFATIGGGQINAIGAGGYESTIGGGYRNTIETFDSTIGGGAVNTIQTNSQYSTIAGGANNRILAGAALSTIGGGSGNLIESNAQYSAIPGGVLNTAGGQSSFAAGYRAKAMHQGSFVWADSQDTDFTSTAGNQFLIRAAGGVGINNNNPNGAALAVNGNVTVNNTIGTPGNQPLELKVNNQRALRLEPTTNTDTVNVIGGSARNFVGPGVAGATIGGGGAGDFTYLGLFSFTNQVASSFGTVSGGGNNTISTDAEFTTIGGGLLNTIQAGARTATIGGGQQNSIENALAATIGGGSLNDIQVASEFATIAGGLGNTIQGYVNYPTIGGGQGNTIQSGAFYASIGGGAGNTAKPNADYATIPGGLANSATNHAFAAGRRAKANHTGAFVWADSTDADFASTTNNQFAIRATGGVVLSDSTPNLSFGSTTRQMINLWGARYGIGVQGLTTYFRTDGADPNNGFSWYKGGVHNDAYANPGGGIELMHLVDGGLYVHGTFNNTSDRNAKQDFAEVNSRTVLEKVAQLPIQTWAYKGDPGTKHLGPVAQDFYAAFNIGPDDKHIATVDESGVALAAIQGLNQKVDELKQELNRRDTENAELKQRLEKLERLMEQHTASR